MSCDDIWVADPKDPADAVWFKWDFSAWLKTGETLTGTPTMTPSTGLFVGSGALASGATCVVALISGGVLGVYNECACHCQTNLGETVQRSLKFLVETR